MDRGAEGREPEAPDVLDRRRFLRGIAASGAFAGTGALAAGSSSDTIDPHRGVTYMDTARLQSLYDFLVQLNSQAQIEYALAESITPNKGLTTEWIIRLRPGVTFHNGQDLTAGDVLYNFRRIVSNKFSGSNGLGPIDLDNTKALDKRTVQVSMTKPFASFVEQLAS